MKHARLLRIFLGLILTCKLWAEPRVWTSISSSTIEATFIGAFGEDYWFEASEDGRFMKMPAKYISESDVKLVESGGVDAVLDDEICDKEIKSIVLLERIYTSKAVTLPPEADTMKVTIEALIAPF